MTEDQGAISVEDVPAERVCVERSRREALDAARAGGDPSALTDALLRLGGTLVLAGRAESALPVVLEALDVAARRGDPATRYRATVELALAHQQLGRWTDAYRALLDAFEQAGQLGDHRTVPFLRAGIAATLLALGRTVDALPAAEVAVRAYREVDDPQGLGRALVTWGQARHAAGDVAGARALWEEAAELLEGADPPGAGAARELLSST